MFICAGLMFHVILVAVFRYKDLIVPTLGDKKKLSAEEKCRFVLQQSKLQGWQVCLCARFAASSSFSFFFVSVSNKRFDLIPDPVFERSHGI